MKKKQFLLMIASIVAIIFFSVGCSDDPADNGGNGDGGDTVINIAAIPGVTTPAGGETPVTEITPTDQYTGTVSWSLADNTFDYETVYTATITLTAKSGFTLNGVTADFFTVAGAISVTNDANTGVVTAEFPETGGPTVMYEANGGSAGNAPTDTAEYSSGDKVTVLDNGNLVGALVGGDHSGTGIKQRFLGWNTDSGATTATYAPGSTFIITEDTTLYAIYTTGTDVLRKVGPAGGLIFYIDTENTQSWTYLEAWTSNESDTYQWKTDNTITAGTLTTIGTGYANTYNCMTGDEHPAAKVVREATHGGFDDWFLPSKDELNQMYVNLKSKGVGGFANGGYWSSSASTNYFAWYQGFTSGIQKGDGKVSSLRVRAVRAF